MASSALRGWWRSHGHRFATAMVVTAAVVTVVGWWTGIRDVMHGVLLAIAVGALLPFLIIGALLAVALGMVAVLAIADAGDGLVEAGVDLPVESSGGLFRGYYGFLARRRHPMFWGIPAGLLLGGLVLWGIVALVIVPGESRTVQILAASKATLDEHHRAHGRFPEPVDGQLVLDGRPVLDGFGRALGYEVTGPRTLASWTLSSTGFDRARPSDDLCVGGATRLAALADKARYVMRAYDELRTGRQDLATRLDAIQALRCARR